MTEPPAAAFLVFEGRSWIRNFSQKFSVLCGDTPPMIMDGYALWDTVARPLSTGVTLFKGYNPAQMKCELRFINFLPGGGWDTQHGVEDRISRLEWMAGANFGTGRSPVVLVRSFLPGGGLSDLVPPAWRHVPWVITAMDWTIGQTTRNSRGSRIWEDVAVTLTKYVGFDKAPKWQTSQGVFQVSNPGMETPLQIANQPGLSTPLTMSELLARQIVNDPHNAPLQLRSIRQRIKHGSRVWVPGTTSNSSSSIATAGAVTLE